MSKMIENFYKEHRVPEPLLKQKLVKFEQNKDVAAEFEYWIETGK